MLPHVQISTLVLNTQKTIQFSLEICPHKLHRGSKPEDFASQNCIVTIVEWIHMDSWVHCIDQSMVVQSASKHGKRGAHQKL